MSPQTAAVATPDTPPKRMTRARAARVTEASDIPTKALAKETTADKPTVPTRGRPRTKTVAAPTAAKPKGRSKTGSVATTLDISEPKKQPAKRGRKKVQEETPESSDDEMDIVTVRARPKAPKAPSSLNMPKNIIRPAVGTTKKRVQAPKGKDNNESGNVGNYDDDDDDDDELAQLELPNQRPGRPKTIPTSRNCRPLVTESSAKAPIRRRRKATAVVADDKSKVTSKKIYISAAALTASSVAAKAKTRVTSAPRREVTFLDMAAESDKENHPIPSSTVAEPHHKIQMGIKGKPIRRTATTTGERKLTTDGEKKEPLSPKKATQIAKSGSSASSTDSADDNLGSPRPRIPCYKGSPIKPSPRRPFDSAIKKIDSVSPVNKSMQSHSSTQGSQSEKPLFCRSVTDAISSVSMILASPARKLPPSPFKESMRDSPRRAHLQPTASISRPEGLDPREISPLKSTPKKGKLSASIFQSPFNPTTTPSRTKSMLLRSPAKRPPSPIKPVVSDRPESPASETASELRREDAFLHPAKQPLSSEVERESTTGSVNEQVKAESKSEDIFIDGLIDLDLSVLDAVLSTGENGGESCQPEVDEGSSDEDTMKPPAQKMEDPFIITDITSMPPSPVGRYEIINPDASVSSLRSYQCIPPAAPSPPAFTAKSHVQFAFRDDTVEESEDELMTDTSPIRFNIAQSRRETLFCNATLSAIADNDEDPEEKLGFTPLAEKLRQWDSISPVKRRSSRVQGRGIFSPLKQNEPIANRQQDIATDIEMKDEAHLLTTSRTSAPSFFEDAMSMQHHESMEAAIPSSGSDDKTAIEPGDSKMDELNIHEKWTPELYEDIEGDGETYENAAPTESTVPIGLHYLGENESQNESAEKENSILLPMSVTPVRSRVYPRMTHTVSKVPLRPDGDGFVLKVPRKRSRSLSSPRKTSNAHLGTGRSLPTISPRKREAPMKPFSDDIVECEPEPELPDKTPTKYSTTTWPQAAVNHPKKSPSKPKSNKERVLRGAVVFADVHTAEGADASGIFVELLTQMGARCVKSWSWNPRASLSPVEGVDPKEGKVGITHVVFKDGGVRTLEKVREANGLVKCVGVSWVLDCERKSKWLDESNYGVDVSLVPRGGQKRRKSMEPRVLSNMNGSIIKLDSSTSSNSGRCSVTDRETFQELMGFSPTAESSRRDSMEWGRVPSTPQPEKRNHLSNPTNLPWPTGCSPNPMAESPTTPEFNYAFDFDGASALSPITPFHPSQGTKLTQQTCPPKQLRQGLFDDKGRDDDQMSEGLKLRLEAARRKSLVWKPKVGSPLGRARANF
ncbi:hypothetical protein PAAG_03236 [Paracoccidioides lutzii Pb01]|uniref:BRCT domain-containing protein n=1 Tax=Paracoccidioides lutzii (strain ATCC MYA-826 / Pb01) TaxID=502779 RepID=C1GXV3_PARBA|nr:hypothetical protein PAAG_03236 [Paracoccidioides lutzii Pb01]EEH41673.1 hypothetical protein PAAG_03236 [Paracoccidioides lutzii Pb01]